LRFGYGACAEPVEISATVREMAAVATRHGFDNAIITGLLE
jgi:hypothetical protein